MAGQAWKYSHQLDERDLAFLQHDFITIPMGMEYYGFSERPLIRMAKEANAFYKIGKMTRINRNIFDAEGYLSFALVNIEPEETIPENEDE